MASDKHSAFSSPGHFYHPLLHSIQDTIMLDDGREFTKTHCYCDGKQVGPANERSHNNSRSSSNSFISDLVVPTQSKNYLPPYAKKRPKKKMKFRFEYHEVVQ